jgi:hypothetical protein
MALRGKEHLGLCSSCKTASDCHYMKDVKSRVLQCEEFEGYEPRIVKTTGKKLVKTSSNPGSSNEEKDSSNHRGLCNICEDREICNFPKPEGGVWHCEEYR